MDNNTVRFLVSLPACELEKIDQEAKQLFVSRNTYINWIILCRNSEIDIPIRSRSDEPQKNILTIKK